MSFSSFILQIQSNKSLQSVELWSSPGHTFCLIFIHSCKLHDVLQGLREKNIIYGWYSHLLQEQLMFETSTERRKRCVVSKNLIGSKLLTELLHLYVVTTTTLDYWSLDILKYGTTSVPFENWKSLKGWKSQLSRNLYTEWFEIDISWA